MEIKSQSQTQSQQPISDDQELAKVLAGVDQQADAATTATDSSFPPMPLPDDISALTAPAIELPEPTMNPVAMTAPSMASYGNGTLDDIKKAALGELRPLVDKLNVSAEEKFDTYLLLIRSTDDQSLVAPAHEAAKGIQDEARRAQALLDIIKEIDFLSQPQQQ